MEEEELIGIAARCWCEPTTSHLVMEPALCTEFARQLAEARRQGALEALDAVDNRLRKDRDYFVEEAKRANYDPYREMATTLTAALGVIRGDIRARYETTGEK